jgi:hypothetical protein
MEQMTARRRLMNAQDIYDHACVQVVNRIKGRAHQRRRIELMMYAMPSLELEAAKEDRSRVKAQLAGFFNGMVQDIRDTYTPNTLRK